MSDKALSSGDDVLFLMGDYERLMVPWTQRSTCGHPMADQCFEFFFGKSLRSLSIFTISEKGVSRVRRLYSWPYTIIGRGRLGLKRRR